MREITDQTRNAWLAEVKDGESRPVVRATVELGQLQWWDYYTENSPGANDYGKERPRGGHYSSWIFGGRDVQEIPNIKAITISRNLDQDVADCTITLLNTIVVPMGETEDEYSGSEEYDLPGALSYNRGNPTIEANRWGHTVDTGWQNRLVPDRVVRTYSGYGIDPSVPAGIDAHMYASGVWLIDTAQEDDAGNLVLKCRDLGRTLIDHIAMPPDIPWDSYPLEWSKIQVATDIPTRAPTGGSFHYYTPQLTGAHQVNARSSNGYYVGAGIVDRPAYVSPSGNVLGHHDLDPLRINQYWLSTGQESADSMVWWEMDLDDPVALAALRINTYGGPYIVYVSLHNGTDWVGRKKIPYTVGTEGIDIDAKIPFVYRHRIDRENGQDLVLKRAYDGIKKIRLTFTRLRRRPGAKVYPWRAGLRSIGVYTGSFGALGFDNSALTTQTVGNYSDYSDVVAWICSWAGFWWPKADSQRTISYGSGHNVLYDYTGSDVALARGRVWGSLQLTGTAGVADLKADQFDKQPLMDCVLEGTLVKAPLGYVPVESVQVGDVVANRTGWGVVTGRKSSPHRVVVSTVLDGEEVVTSPGHLYWTRRGWVQADELVEGDVVHNYLSSLQEGLRGASSGSRQLRRPMSQCLARLRLVWSRFLGYPDPEGITQDVLREVSARLGGALEDSTSGLHVPLLRREVSGGCREEVVLQSVQGCSADASASGLPDLREELQAEGLDYEVLLDGLSQDDEMEPRDWWSFRGAVRALAGLGSLRMVARVLGLSIRDAAWRHDHATRLGELSPTAQHRGRRDESRSKRSSSQRSSAGRLAAGTRVDRVEIHRIGDPEWPRFSSSDGLARMWDLSVDGDPSFVVGKGEHVVHNCIQVVRNIVGFTFNIDECGGVVWRMPNLYQKGNYLTPGHLDNRAGRHPTYIDAHEVIDERVSLISYSTTLDSSNLRERVGVTATNGKIGSVIKGYTPYRTGMKRIALWSDEHFDSNRECRVAADMIAAQQMFSFRRSTIVIPHNPAIQLDDQIRVYERVTNETFYHYVVGISTAFDADTGTLQDTLETHWLGERISDAWVIRVDQLDAFTQEFLNTLGPVN